MQEKVEMAEDILDVVTANMCRKAPFMQIFANAFERVPVAEDILLETDGLRLFYQPDNMIRQFRDKALPHVEERLLHMVLHGLLGHFEMREQLECLNILDAAMDYEAVRLAGDLGWDKEGQEICFYLEQIGEITKETKNQLSSMGARQLYFGAMEDRTLYNFFSGAESHFERDDHTLWSRRPPYHSLRKGEEWVLESGFPIDGTKDDERDEEEQERIYHQRMVRKKWGQMRKALLGSESPGEEVVKGQLKALGNTYGMGVGTTDAVVEAAAANDRSYRHILEQFFRFREQHREQEDNIDRMLYSYGFELYGDVALVEPEESGDAQKLHTIALAIDTSGSCSGEIMVRFLRETKNILRDVCLCGGFEQLLLLQCDAEIQDEKIYYDPEALPQEESFHVFGFGGTDFRPVFWRLEDLKKEKGIQVDCLLYLTDGCGEYPDRKPDYPVYFILPYGGGEYDYWDDFPDWIQKVYL